MAVFMRGNGLQEGDMDMENVFLVMVVSTVGFGSLTKNTVKVKK